jgi:hypothetical protein
MRHGWILLGALILSATLVACLGEEETNWAKWDIGLTVSGQGEEVVTTKVYKQTKGNDATEQKGTIQSGALADNSSGTVTITETNSFGDVFRVVGEMDRTSYVPGLSVCNPCCDGDDLKDVRVYVTEAERIWRGKSLAKETYIELRNGNRFEYFTENSSYTDRETEAFTYGLAGEDYLVRIDDLGGIYGDLSGSTFLSRRNASVGDFWVSPNGHITYEAVDESDMKIGEKSGKAVVVELRSAENISSMDITGACLTEYSDRNTQAVVTGVSPSGFYTDVVSTMIHLDPGCEGNFVHRKIGTEYWMDNVLVKEETTYYEVTILDYGYEWMEITEDSKYMRTSKVLTADVPSNATIFALFSVTERTVTWEAKSWDVVKDENTEDEGLWPVDPASYLADDEKITGGIRPGENTSDGDMPDGDEPIDGDAPEDGDVPFDGDVPDGDVPDGDVPDGDVPDGDMPDGDMPDGDMPDGDMPIPGAVGAPCENSTECETNMCMDTSTFQELSGTEYNIVGGYCTTLDEETCRDADAQPIDMTFLGSEYEGLSVCAQPCESYSDCREADSQYCWNPYDLVTYEYLTEGEVETYFGTSSLCLPDAVLNWLYEVLYNNLSL